MKNTITATILLFGMTTFAQNQHPPCAFDRLVNNHKIEHANQIIMQGETLLQKANHTNKTIPVVVHVFHLGGSENISDAQILSTHRQQYV